MLQLFFPNLSRRNKFSNIRFYLIVENIGSTETNKSFPSFLAMPLDSPFLDHQFPHLVCQLPPKWEDQMLQHPFQEWHCHLFRKWRYLCRYLWQNGLSIDYRMVECITIIQRHWNLLGKGQKSLMKKQKVFQKFIPIVIG